MSQAHNDAPLPMEVSAVESKQAQVQDEKQAKEAKRKALQLEVGHHSAKGIRSTMEDEVAMKTGFEVKNRGQFSFFAVYDGHGGSNAAEFVRDNLLVILMAELDKGLEVEKALYQSFITADEKFLKNSPDASGTTAVVLVIEHATRNFYVAHVGDSRAVLCRQGKALTLTKDHKADRPDEVERIRKAGGFVIHKRVMGELAISRAIGDADFKEQELQLVIAEPELARHALQEDDEFVLLACDGLFDVMTDDEAIKYIRDKLAGNKGEVQLNKVCEELVTHSIDELNTRDNVSLLIIRFRQ